MKLVDWLAPCSKLVALFEFKPHTLNQTSKFWQAFSAIKEQKPDVDENDLPNKWIDWKEGQGFAGCNCCGSIVGVGPNNKAGTFKQTIAGMKSHLEMKHRVTIETMAKKIEQHEIANNSNKERPAKRANASVPQGKIDGWVKSGKMKLPLALVKANQDLKTVKFLTMMCMLPFNMVEKDSFREMIEAHNPHFDAMSNKKIKAILMTLENAMGIASTAKMEGNHVSITTDHWTFKQGQSDIHHTDCSLHH